MDVVKKWSNQIENKFMKYEYQQSDALSRKIKLFKKEVNAIDVFGFGALNEKIVHPKSGVLEEKNSNGDEDEDVDLLMVEESLGLKGIDDGFNDIDHDKIWNEWENKEKMKLETMRNNLNEKRVTKNKSLLISEFE